LSKRGAANREVSDEAARRTLFKIERGIVLEQIKPVLEQRPIAQRERKYADIAIGFGQWNRFRRTCDDHDFAVLLFISCVIRRVLPGHGNAGGEQNRKDYA
jgi:hypothetical protein